MENFSGYKPEEAHPGRKWTQKEIDAVVADRKRRFIEEYRKCANIARSCRATGVDRKQFRLWMERDETFGFEFNEAREDAIDALEEEARRRAVDGCLQKVPIYYKGEMVGEREITEYSDSMLTLLLKANRPEKFKERVDVTTTTIVKQYGGIDLDRV